MAVDIKKFQSWVKENPLLGYPLVVVCIAGFLLLSFMGKPGGERQSKVESPKVEDGALNADVNMKAYMARMEKNYGDYEERIKSMEEQIKNDRADMAGLMSKQILQLGEQLSQEISDQLKASQGDLATKRKKKLKKSADFELEIADIAPVEDTIKENEVYLPMGSFCRGTLLTGVYAPADQNSPLPVLISLDEAFYGPNKTRIPLKGAFVLGKAYGDLVSERAMIQITGISAILPNEISFENQENLGYVTDEYGELGIHGRVIYNTGRQLAISFASGFISGGSQALADSQTTALVTTSGRVVRGVTGNTSQHAVFSGLSKSAAKLSEFYERQAENLVPAIHISNGQKVVFVVQKGVHIDGLTRVDHHDIAYAD